MALFKFRKGRDEQPAPVSPAQTVEAVRRRAMHRLIGAAVLVLAGVIGFPLVFDNQPRPIPVDLPIEIVDKNKVKPLVLPSAAPLAGASSGAVSSPPGASTKPVVPESKAVAAAPPAPATAPAPANAAATDKSGVAAKAPGADERFVVQVGAFTDQAKVREVRRKVEAAGLKTYTQVVGTSDGDRTRVRVGPFTDKAEAGKAADKIRKLDLPAAVLTL